MIFIFDLVKSYDDRTGKPEEIGRILSALQLLSDMYEYPEREWIEGNLNTADPAFWSDWIDAVETVLKEDKGNVA